LGLAKGGRGYILWAIYYPARPSEAVVDDSIVPKPVLSPLYAYNAGLSTSTLFRVGLDFRFARHKNGSVVLPHHDPLKLVLGSLCLDIPYYRAGVFWNLSLDVYPQNASLFLDIGI
jgi:hypothetical protein